MPRIPKALALDVLTKPRLAACCSGAAPRAGYARACYRRTSSTKEQNEMVRVVEKVTNRINTENKILNLIEIVKSAPMSVLLTGEVRVKVDEAEA